MDEPLVLSREPGVTVFDLREMCNSDSKTVDLRH